MKCKTGSPVKDEAVELSSR